MASPYQSGFSRALAGVSALLILAALTFPGRIQAQQVDWSTYMDYAAVSDNVQRWTQTHAEIARLQSMGKSHEGRDLWVVTVTNRATGAPEDKPALYVEGGMDSDEIMTTQAAMYLLHTVLNGYGRDATITDLVDTRTLYLAPNIIPDQSENYHQTPKRVRDSTTRPYDNDADGVLDEDDMEDVDGDGRILQMRVEDAQGAFKVDPEDARVMLPRRPADGADAGPFYRLYSSEGIDNDEDGRFNEDPVGGVDPNRNWPAHWVQEYQQSWAGPYPLSEVENRNVIRFYMEHPNIGSVVDLHTSGNLLYRPSSVYPDEEMDLTDLTFYRAMGQRYVELTDGPVLTPLERARSRGARGVYGSGIMIDWLYDHRGVFSFAPELWAFPVDDHGVEQRDASESEQIDWAEEQFGPDVWIEWKRFHHAQLGDVELGGWSKPMPNNPMGPHVERIASEIGQWMIHVWGRLPRLEIAEAQAERIDERTFKVRVTVTNTGFMSTNVTERALTVGSTHPVFLSVRAGAGAGADAGIRIIAMAGGEKGFRNGTTGLNLGHLGGWGSTRTAISRARSATAELLIVHESGPARVEVVVDGQRAGKLRRTIELPRR